MAKVLLFLLLVVLATAVNPQKPPQNEDPAEWIAYAGHGGIFDANMKEVRLDDSMIAAIQFSILAKLAKIAADDPALETPSVKAAQELLKDQKLTTTEAMVLRAGIIKTQLQFVPEDLQARYSWRNEVALSAHLANRFDQTEPLRMDAASLARSLGVFEPDPDPEVDADGNTRYMRLCRLLSVPIPPDWAEEGTPWVFQGALRHNMLRAGEYAGVWTYSDPAIRGGCIALPRGDGSPGTVAGIICQSATTGGACFWDNKLRASEPEVEPDGGPPRDPVPVGWAGRTLVISELKDGSNLVENCTGCHRGNNVFLIAPDDPTWSRVMKGLLHGPRTGTFSVRVDAYGPPTELDRYFPVTYLPQRPGWENPREPSPCAGACHERATDTSNPPNMVPAPDCSTVGTDPPRYDHERCYRAP